MTTTQDLIARLEELRDYKYQSHTIHVPAVLEQAATRLREQEQEIARLQAIVDLANPPEGKVEIGAMVSQIAPKELVEKALHIVRAERDALRQDAERYRWLRENQVGYGMHMGAVLYTPELVVPRNMDENGIDAAIDATRRGNEL